MPVSIENYPGYVNRSPHISDILAIKIWKYSMSRDLFKAWLLLEVNKGTPTRSQALKRSLETLSISIS